MRVTLDLDDVSYKIVEGKAKLLKIAYPRSKVMWRLSSSRNGGHIMMYSDDVDEDTMYNIRYLLGDHDKRIAIDWGRGKFGNPMLPKQVLFGWKLRRCSMRYRCEHYDTNKCRIKRIAGEWNYV